MSFIINNSSAFVNIKLTETGRQKLAQGKLNFTSWAIGDSEINYDREDVYDNYSTDATLSATTKVLRPVDKQPDLKYFITANSNSNQNLNTLNQSQIITIKGIVNNQATERGFFSANTAHDNYITYTSSTYVKATGLLSGSTITGGTDLVIGTGHTYQVGDYLLLKISNDTTGSLTLNQNTIATPQLWYKIDSQTTTINLNDTVVLDRSLPNINSTTAQTQWLIYTSDEVYSGFGEQESTPYWNTNTLSFASCCEVSAADVPVWNMNNVWCENLAGMTGASVNSTVSTPNESYEKFGSYSYLGQKYPYLEYKCSSSGITGSDPCAEPGQSIVDSTKKSLSILHYTNNSTSNFYGEYFYIDGLNNKTLKLHLPDLMYHRRNFGTESGSTMGMDFIATGSTKLIGDSKVEYVDLIEDPTKVDGTARVVGKVLPQYKTVVFSDDEIVAATSYKSNRNWTLPYLSANLISSASGASNGVLGTKKTMYLTYTFENSISTGLTTTLPCQYYTKISNNTSASKDVEFKLNDIDLLPYMRKEEKAGYDGKGFSAREFKVIYQIVDDVSDRPLPDAWKVHDFTSTAITVSANETIEPKLLERQTPSLNSFLIDQAKFTGDSTFSIINSLSMATNSNPDDLQFGDEKFFYGNLETYIGASIYKTTFRIDISADDFKSTGNPTRSNASVNEPDIRVTEVGIYDSVGALVMIGKLSKPVLLSAGNTITFELSMDF